MASIPSAILAAALLLPIALTGSLGLPSSPGTPQVMQADAQSPLWASLRALGHTPATWASLLTTDADGNGRTDFLDLAVLQATATGQLATPVELLAYGPADAQAALASWPGAVRIEAVGAIFLTASLARVADLQLAGATLLVWEPRAFADSSTNPAGGSPATMSQHSISQVGTAWAANRHGNGVRIAILDTGVDAAHQALSQTGKVAKWKDCVGTATTAYDDHGHGTHVASIAAGNDSTDFKGVADQATITGIKILDAAGSGSLAGFQCGVNYVKSGGAGGAKTADVASMSAGLGVPPLGLTTLNGGELDVFGWDAVADQLPAANIPFTVAAGNWAGTVVEVIGLDETTHVGVNGVNQVSSPGFSRSVVTVGAVDYMRAPTTFTAIGPGHGGSFKPDVVTQGLDTWGALAGTTSQYEQWAGTSMATPIAAGVAALLVGKTSGLSHISYENALRNGAVNACVLSASTTTCSVAQPPLSMVTGRGVVNAVNSLTYV